MRFARAGDASSSGVGSGAADGRANEMARQHDENERTKDERNTSSDHARKRSACNAHFVRSKVRGDEQARHFAFPLHTHKLTSTRLLLQNLAHRLLGLARSCGSKAPRAEQRLASAAPRLLEGRHAMRMSASQQHSDRTNVAHVRNQCTDNTNMNTACN